MRPKYFANSDGQDLYKHSICVAILCYILAVKLGLPEVAVQLCFICGLLHDIGKTILYFSKYMFYLNDDEDNETDESNEYGRQLPRHNEIGWLWCISNFVSKDFELLCAPEIYWHHYTSRRETEICKLKSDDICQQALKEDPDFLNKMSQFVMCLVSNVKSLEHNLKTNFTGLNANFESFFKIDNKSSHYSGGVSIPNIFSKETDMPKNGYSKANPWRLSIRACLKQADLIVSKMSNQQMDELLLETTLAEKYCKSKEVFKKDISEIKCPDGYSADRFEMQKDCVSKMGKTTTIANAPGGFGKTMIGVLSHLQGGNQTYWVVPRNMVARDVFDNVVEEIKALNINVTVELYLTGKRQDKHGNISDEDCSADIVVTNLDNLLSPVGSHKSVNRLFLVTAGNIIFDEYHEFKNDTALYGVFLILMKLRHRYAKNTKTLLLSATPDFIYKLWDTEKNKTVILPNENEHYKAQHKNLYSFGINKSSISGGDKRDGSMTTFNSVFKTQQEYKEYGDYTKDKIIHGSYFDEDLDAIRKEIFKLYGKKNAKNDLVRGKVISCQIIKAAAELSFYDLYCSAHSPETELQKISRQDRWGFNKGINKIYISDLFDDIHERYSIINSYDYDLYKVWVKFMLLEFNGKTMTLDDMFGLYNKFNRQNEKKIIDYHCVLERKSLEKLNCFYPRKTNKKQAVDPNEKRTGKTLRNSSLSYFFVVPGESGKWCSGCFQAEKEDMEKLYQKNRNKGSCLDSIYMYKKIHKELIEAGHKCDDKKIKRYVKKCSDPIPFDVLLNAARCSDNPIPIKTMKYNKVLGLIDLTKK